MRRSYLAAVAVLVALSALALGLAACGEKSEDVAPEAQPLSLTLDFYPNPDHAGIYMAQKLGYYTIGSAGHESNALVALALSPTDPALLHYRSGAFYLARAGQAGRDGAWDVLLGMAAAVEEPMAGGRHKVFGHHDLAVIPQTSTIASHLPRAVGIAFAIERARELGVASAWSPDAVVVCSFGDASLNHATAQSALNAAAHFAYRGERLPLLFVCEDNGLGISVPTPEGWVEQALHGRMALRQFEQPAVLQLRAGHLRGDPG